ncbi:unnamed protein product [Chrysoparadoxa australica]
MQRLLQEAFKHDLCELPELDNLFCPEEAIRDAELLASEAFQSKRTWLLTNGSTSGVLASILGCVQHHQSSRCIGRSSSSAGSVVVLPRDAHKSAINALVLTGSRPVFLPTLGLHACADLQSLKGVLQEHEGSVAAVLLVSPSYEGGVLDIAAASEVCHAEGIPLIVDEAHGSHLQWLQGSWPDCPEGALALGADLVVQSTHKTLASLTQSALLHQGISQKDGDLIGSADASALGRCVTAALGILQSSSPSYLLMAGLDAARWQLAAGDGVLRLVEAAEACRAASCRLKDIPGVLVNDEVAVSATGRWDPLKLTVSLLEKGYDGYELDDLLTERFGVYSELPTPRAVTFAFGIGSRMQHTDTLVQAIKELALEPYTGSDSVSTGSSSSSPAADMMKPLPPPGQFLLSPRSSFFAPSTAVPAAEAVGMPSAETVCPYPPGKCACAGARAGSYSRSSEVAFTG